jgi:hypothetical protein
MANLLLYTQQIRHDWAILGGRGANVFAANTFSPGSPARHAWELLAQQSRVTHGTFLDDAFAHADRPAAAALCSAQPVIDAQRITGPAVCLRAGAAGKLARSYSIADSTTGTGRGPTI